MRNVINMLFTAPAATVIVLSENTSWTIASDERTNHASSGVKCMATPFMQYRWPVGCGPSLKTCPRWPSQSEHRTSVRTMKKDLSLCSVTEEGSTGWKKLGQPVPLSNLASDLKSGFPHPAHENTPSRFSSFNGDVPARSVPCLRNTLNCSGVSVSRHSSLVFSNLRVGVSVIKQFSFQWKIGDPIASGKHCGNNARNWTSNPL